MVCRHAPGDPFCSSSPEGQRRLEDERYEYARKQEAKKQKATDRTVAALQQEIAELTVDSSRFRVDEIENIGNCLVMKVKYPSCKKCEFEGTKVMVFENVTWKRAFSWDHIDPHFSGPDRGNHNHAPSPVARFPANDLGWKRAIQFAQAIQG